MIRLEIGRNLSINCQANGKPTPNLSWRKRIDNNTQIVLNNCSSSSSICYLNLSQVIYADSGVYECIAMNIVGTISRSYELDVQCKISISN